MLKKIKRFLESYKLKLSIHNPDKFTFKYRIDDLVRFKFMGTEYEGIIESRYCHEDKNKKFHIYYRIKYEDHSCSYCVNEPDISREN